MSPITVPSFVNYAICPGRDGQSSFRTARDLGLALLCLAKRHRKKGILYSKNLPRVYFQSLAEHARPEAVGENSPARP